jgi:hypothetical protein
VEIVRFSIHAPVGRASQHGNRYVSVCVYARAATLIVSSNLLLLVLVLMARPN